MYKISYENYDKLLSENITQKYKKEKHQTAASIVNECKSMAKKLHIENRLRPTIEKPAFITNKDHKENFENNMKCRLIYPTKTEIGRVSKYILDRINTDIRSKCKLNQWKNTKDVINWFSQLRQKNKLTILTFDIIDFYPSISDELLNKSIEWARKHTSIDDQEYETIIQRIPPARTIAVALDMSKAFDTVDIHTLTKKLLDTQIPPIIIKFIANYIIGRKAFTTYNNKTSTQRQFKTGVPQGGVLSPTLFNIYTSDIPSPPPNITVYADDITMTSTDTNKQIAQAKLQPYLQEIASWTQQNQLHLNPDKTTSTLFTPNPAEYSTQITLNIDNVVIPTVKNPKILGLTFDPKLTYNAHIRKASDKARNTLKLLKALTSTKWGKQKETIVATYKAITRPILEYASTIWSPIASTTGITKLQTIQNMALRIATGCTSDTNIQHLHNETNILPLSTHLKLHSSQLRQKSQHPTHPLHSSHRE